MDRATNDNGEIAAATGLDAAVVALVQQRIGDAPLVPLTVYDDEDAEKVVNAALVAEVPQGESERALYVLRDDLRPPGCCAFWVEKTFDFENKPDRIAVLATGDDLEIVRVVRTDACNYDLGPDDVLARLGDWRRRVIDFDVLGAEGDTIHLHFRALPVDLPAFAGELYGFCPDLLDQGYLVMVEEALDELPPEQQERIERALVQEDGDAARAALRLLADDLRESRRLSLWWD